MKIYLAGPLFTTAERDYNAALATRLAAVGHDVFLPQAHEGDDQGGRAIFAKDLAGLQWSEAIVAITDGADPDSGTSWEIGWAYATGRPIVLFRSDFRRPGDSARGIPYNAMLVESSTVHLERALASVDEAAAAIVGALETLVHSR